MRSKYIISLVFLLQIFGLSKAGGPQKDVNFSKLNNTAALAAVNEMKSDINGLEIKITGTMAETEKIRDVLIQNTNAHVIINSNEKVVEIRKALKSLDPKEDHYGCINLMSDKLKILFYHIDKKVKDRYGNDPEYSLNSIDDKLNEVQLRLRLTEYMLDTYLEEYNKDCVQANKECDNSTFQKYKTTISTSYELFKKLRDLLKGYNYPIEVEHPFDKEIDSTMNNVIKCLKKNDEKN